jgi:hypothetical protein
MRVVKGKGGYGTERMSQREMELIELFEDGRQLEVLTIAAAISDDDESAGLLINGIAK